VSGAAPRGSAPESTAQLDDGASAAGVRWPGGGAAWRHV